MLCKELVAAKSYLPYSTPLWNRWGAVFGCVCRLRGKCLFHGIGWKGRIWQLCKLEKRDHRGADHRGADHSEGKECNNSIIVIVITIIIIIIIIIMIVIIVIIVVIIVIIVIMVIMVIYVYMYIVLFNNINIKNNEGPSLLYVWWSRSIRSIWNVTKEAGYYVTIAWIQVYHLTVNALPHLACISYGQSPY